jgi:hypothetical protein
MVTPADTKVAAKLYAKLLVHGTDATFRTFPSLAADYDESSVVEGTPTDFVWKVTPPDFTGDGGEDLDGTDVEGGEVPKERCEIWMATANGTANAAGFTPVLKMRVQVAAKWWDIIKVTPIWSGDLLAAYGLKLED